MAAWSATDLRNRGSYETEEAALEVVVARLIEGLHPEAIYLFGSRARGDNRPESDFDLLVVMPTEAGEAGRDYARAHAPLAGLGIGCDVVPCLRTDFERAKDRPASLCHEVSREGRKLYELA
jgi:predicted nucleotidyltransferase